MMDGNSGAVIKSIAVISALEYLRAIIASSTGGLVGDYSGLLARALVTYLEFAAYAQGWITIPARVGA